MMPAVTQTMLETGHAWEQDGVTAGEVREMIGAVDETCVEQMMLVSQDGSTGDMVQEEVADDRTYATWKALVDERLQALGTSMLYVVSDRATALIQLAGQGLACLSMPEFFLLMHDMVKSYALTIARQVRQAHKALTQAEAVLASPPGLARVAPDRSDATAEMEAKRAEVTRWEELQRTYQHQLETLSLTLHPFSIAAAAPQTSA